MNLSQKLLLALAGASISAPLAAPAQEVASLTGAAAINEYMQQQDVDRFRAWESKNQVTSVNQFSDVLPTDWAYQALSNLVEKYGCVAGYPNGKFKGGNAMTRYEAAALLNACLDRISEVTDELQKLLNEFDSELTVLTSRVDGLESKVGQLQAQQFSTTTKLRGEVSFVIGGTPNFNSNAVTNTAAVAAVRGVSLTNGRLAACNAGTTGCIGGSAATPARTAKPNATTFNYDARLAFDTSFSEIVLPAPDRGLRNPDLAHDRRDPITIGVHEDDPDAFGDLLRRIAIGKQSGQLSADFPLQYNSNLSVLHPRTESYFSPGIQMLITEH